MSIVFDSSSSAPFTTAASLTWSHTCAGTNKNGILLVGVYFAVAIDAPSAITYGSAVSNGSFSLAVGAATGIRLYYFFNPPIGANTVTVVPTASILLAGTAESLTGVGRFVDSNGTNTSTAASLTVATSVLAPDCWLIGVSGINGVGISAMSMSTGTQRTSVLNSTTSGLNMGDSNGTVSTGSQQLVFGTTDTSTTSWGGIVVSIPQLVPEKNPYFLAMIGCGR